MERNLLHTGRLYCQSSESTPARNHAEFSEALSQMQPGQHKIVIFAMLTNLVVNAGNTAPSNNLEARLHVIEAYLKKLVRTIT